MTDADSRRGGLGEAVAIVRDLARVRAGDFDALSDLIDRARLWVARREHQKK